MSRIVKILSIKANSNLWLHFKWNNIRVNDDFDGRGQTSLRRAISVKEGKNNCPCRGILKNILYIKDVAYLDFTAGFRRCVMLQGAHVGTQDGAGDPSEVQIHHLGVRIYIILRKTLKQSLLDDGFEESLVRVCNWGGQPILLNVIDCKIFGKKKTHKILCRTVSPCTIFCAVASLFAGNSLSNSKLTCIQSSASLSLSGPTPAHRNTK